MSKNQIIKNLKVFDDFDPKLRQQIKCCFVGKNAYCVLNDNSVYGLGDLIHQILGYKKEDEKYVKINELCGQNIQEFYEGDCGFTLFARNDKNQIFQWGYTKEKIQPPHKIDFLDDKNIIKISCGNNRCLALSSNGLVYGCQNIGRLGGSGWKMDMKVVFNIHKIFDKIELKTIKNISNNSLHGINSIWVESFNGKVYEFITDQDRWLERDNCNLKEVQELIKNNFNEKMEENNGIIDFCFDRNHQVICETRRWVYVYSRERRDPKMTRTSYKTIFEYFLLSIEATYKTIHFEDNKYYVYNIEIKTKDNSQELVNIRKEYDLEEYCSGQNETNSFLRQFSYSKDLLQISDSIIKYYFKLEEDSFYVVNEKDGGNKVYCLGKKHFGILGIEHWKRVPEHTEIIEFRNENIEDFYASYNCMFARNYKNEIFSWGNNEYGQLARGLKSDSSLVFLKPDKIDFKGKQIIDISIGSYHTLALSSEGCVYAWGKNYWKQNVSVSEDYILTPEEIVLDKSIKFIHCSQELSFVVTLEGEGYCWGEKNGRLIFNQKLIPVTKIYKLYYYMDDQIIILDNKGNISLFDLKNETNNKIDFECKDEIIDLYYNYRYFHDCLVQSEEWVYRLTKNYKIKKFELIKTNFKKISDFYLNEYGYCNKTIEITEKGRFMTKEFHFEENTKELKLTKHYIFDTKYETEFDEICHIGGGSFGEVYKVKKNSNKIDYAIKMMKIDEQIFKQRGLKELELKGITEFDEKVIIQKALDKLVLNEIKTMQKLSPEFVVDYIDSWIEEKIIWPSRNTIVIFIQMELCPHNLKEFIEIMKGIRGEEFQVINYFISCELLRELIECVNHLHSHLTKPIIHRDLKPENILISDGINGKFLKLCDFGFATIHEVSIHSMKGTPKYIAPEVYLRKYNEKADIYSLALIGAEIFQLIDSNYDDQFIEIRGYKERQSFDKYLPKYFGTILENNFNKLLDMISNCLTPEDYHLRPDCTQLKDKINEFSIDKNIVSNDVNISDFKLFLENQNQNTIFKKFFQTKTEEKHN